MVIGVTGRSCSGKDVAVAMLEEKGIPSVNVDKLGHQALLCNKEKIIDAFGEDVLTDGEVDRRKLGLIVFSDSGKLERLNSISHPWMVEKVEEFTSSHSLCTVNAALLEKMGLVRLCDDILYVFAPYGIREERALKRDALSKEAFRNRSASQKEIGSTLFSCGKRVITIINDKEKEYLYRQMELYCDILRTRGYFDE